jgi:hypothetical protein
LLVVAIVAVTFLVRETRPLIRKLLDFSRRHPATRVKERVYRRLRKVGLQPLPSDTGKEVVEKLKTAARTGRSHQRIADVGDLETTFAEFIETYNAIYYGKEDRLPDLKALSSKITTLLKF